MDKGYTISNDETMFICADINDELVSKTVN